MIPDIATFLEELDINISMDAHEFTKSLNKLDKRFIMPEGWGDRMEDEILELLEVSTGDKGILDIVILIESDCEWFVILSSIRTYFRDTTGIHLDGGSKERHNEKVKFERLKERVIAGLGELGIDQGCIEAVKEKNFSSSGYILNNKRTRYKIGKRNLRRMLVFGCKTAQRRAAKISQILKYAYDKSKKVSS